MKNPEKPPEKPKAGADAPSHALRERYLGCLERDAAEIKTLLTGLEEKTSSPADRRRLFALVHGLAGTGGMVGFPQLSECARKAQPHLEEFATRAPDKAALAKTRELTADLLRICDEICAKRERP